MHHIKKFRWGVRDDPPNPLVGWGPHSPTPRRLWHLVHFFACGASTTSAVVIGPRALAQIDAHDTVPFLVDEYNKYLLFHLGCWLPPENFSDCLKHCFAQTHPIRLVSCTCTPMRLSIKTSEVNFEDPAGLKSTEAN